MIDVMRVSVLLRRWVAVRSATPLDALLDPGFVAIDVETTGLDPRRDAVVSIAAIPFLHGRPEPGFATLVDPGRPIPAPATRIHGIDDQRVRGAPALDDVAPRVRDAVAGRIVVGHDVGFDLQFLARTRAKRRYWESVATVLDTRRIAVALRPALKHHAELETVAQRLDIPVVGRHTADGDARLAGQILVTLLPELRARGVRTLGDLLWAQTAVYRRT